MQNYVGQQIDRYRITERLGMGGMAVVYKAYDTRLERDVALKLIRTGEIPESQHDRLFKRFEREAKAQARFSHRNIVPVYDYGEVDGSPYLVMAFISGGTLKEHLHGPVDWRQAVHWLIPVAEALSYAHKEGVIHRDIKPANILFDKEDQPILTDFGIAKVLETDEATLTGTGLGVGTPEYMAPEQWQGKTGAATDQYALGVVLYELITGRKPYSADTPAAIILMQANEPLQAPSKLVRGIPGSVEKVLYKALARDPQDRYENMGEFTLSLRRLLADADTQEAEESFTETSTPAPNPTPTNTEPSEGVTRDKLDATPVEEMDAALKGKRGLPKWALWTGIGVTFIVLLGLAIRGNLGNIDKSNEESLLMQATGISSETDTLTQKKLEDNELIQRTSTPFVPTENTSHQDDENVVFFEDFDDGMAQQIKGVDGDWRILSDELGGKVYDIDNSNGSGFPGIDFGESFWDDYLVKLSVRYLEGQDKWVIIEFRRSANAENKYIISFGADGVWLYYSTASTGWQLITMRTFNIKSEVWYNLEIEMSRTIITVKIDGDILIQTEDSRFSKGSINIQVGPATHAQFDNIEVISLD
ncbi:MAG: serine/threonine protein kinase [Anaerolineaceae bacterium]|nr:serine/threonine protein kinase [Anaerolineaceae bacterium]